MTATASEVPDVMPLWEGRRGEALTYPEPVRVHKWADEHMVLPPDSAERGRSYDSRRTPYAREWMDSIGESWVHQITIVASTQVGKSQSLLNMAAYAVCCDPGPVTLVMPTREDAVEYCEEKIMPAVRASPTWRSQLAGVRHEAKQRKIQFRRARMLMRSSVTPKELAAYPARWLFGDECDKWPPKARGEAPPFNLAKQRTQTYWNHCIILTSTPTKPENLISREHDQGDRRKFWVPCPHCGQHQVLKFGQIKWPEEITTGPQMKKERRAWYECEHCQEAIEDVHKTEMLEAGLWCPEGIDFEDHFVDGRLEWEGRNPHRSYHIWAAYSPWVAFWEIAAEFLATKDTPEFQNFVNSWLGESYVEKVEDTKSSAIRACIGDYFRGQVPEGVLVFTGGVDVQKRFLAYTIRGWGVGMESWLIDHGRVDDFEQLAAILFGSPWAIERRLAGVFIDSNYRTGDVIDFVRPRRDLLHMCSGQAFKDPRPWEARDIDRHPVTGKPIPGLKRWSLNVNLFKDALWSAIQHGTAGDRGYHVYEEVDDRYVSEMTSEHKVIDRKLDTERWEKKTSNSQNHYWDTEVYNLAIAQKLGIQHLQPGQVVGQPKKHKRRSASRPDRQQGGRLWRRT